MRTERTVFHSSEVDDPTLLAEGWYIGAFHGTLYADESCAGPYPTYGAASEAMTVPRFPKDTITVGLHPRLLAE